MTFNKKRWLTWRKAPQYIAILVCIFVVVIVGKTVVLLYPPIVNSIEIQNGTFEYTSSATELQTAISAGNLLSSVVVAGATVIYAIFTYFILDATNKNTQQSALSTQQSALSIQQTANSQKIALLERRLELLYLPLQSALKRFDIDALMEGIPEYEKDFTRRTYVYFEMIKMWWNFRTDYDKIIPFTYLASDNVKKTLVDFTNIFESNKLFVNKYAPDAIKDKTVYDKITGLLNLDWGGKFEAAQDDTWTYHKKLLEAINEEIKSINTDLEKLVNICY